MVLTDVKKKKFFYESDVLVLPIGTCATNKNFHFVNFGGSKYLENNFDQIWDSISPNLPYKISHNSNMAFSIKKFKNSDFRFIRGFKIIRRIHFIRGFKKRRIYGETEID